MLPPFIMIDLESLLEKSCLKTTYKTKNGVESCQRFYAVCCFDYIILTSKKQNCQPLFFAILASVYKGTHGIELAFCDSATLSSISVLDVR